MAAAGKKDDKKRPDEDSAEESAVPDAAKQKKKKLFMFIGIAVLLILISVGATFFIVSKMLHKQDGDEEEVAEVVEEKILPAIYYPLKPNFTVNYDVNGRQRFLQTELTLMYRDEAVVKILETHMPEVRNGLVMLLSNQTFDELQTAEGKEKLRAQALKTVQDIIIKESTANEKGKEKDSEKAKEKDQDKKKDKDTTKKKDKPKEEPKPVPNIEQVLFTQFVMQ